LNAVLLLIPAALAQTTSSISGTVRDAQSALVPGAKITLINEASKAMRPATSNGEGFFNFVAVQPGTYNLQVSKAGFETWTVTGIEVHPGDSLTVPKIKLTVGQVVVSVTVSAETAGVSLNSGEHSTLITAGDINRLSTQGRDAAELVSMLPGFTVNSATDVQNEGAGGLYGYQTMGFGSGQVSSYGANGSAPKQGAVNVTSDGANVIDPGDMGGQISNVNMDQVQEIKVQTSNFGADEAKGPIVINAVGKSGSDTFHGGLYTYFRNAGLNANDWLTKYYGSKRPENKYYYPGATISGPVKIPGLHFNEKKQLVFWAGYEYYGQDQTQGLATAFVPNAAMLAGDLSNNQLAAGLNVDAAALATNCPHDYSVASLYSNVESLCFSPNAVQDTNGVTVTNGDMSKATGSNSIDPASTTFTGIYPAISRIPQPVVTNGVTQYASDGINYVQNVMATHNGFQFHTKIDESFSDTLKLTGTYNWEKVNDQSPTNNNYNNQTGTIAFPTPFDSNTLAHYLTLNLTKTIGSSVTNELIGSGVYFYEPGQFADRSKAQAGGAWASEGYNGGEQKLKSASFAALNITQLPIINNWGDASGNAVIPGFQMAYAPTNSRYLRKISWNLADNLTKQYRTHTIKVGVYTEETANNQSNLGSQLQGALAFMEWDACYYNQATATGSAPAESSLGNQLANFLAGCAMAYSQDNTDPTTDLRYRDFAGYVTDDWKVNSKLTLTLGLRLQHTTPWTDAHGIGLAVWNPAADSMIQNTLYSSVGTDPATWKGVQWNKKNSNVPLTGVPVKPVFVSPRFGMAYDLHGNGKTVFHGGWGVYRFHDSYNNSAGAANTSSGLQTYTIPGTQGCTYQQLFTSSVVGCSHYYTSTGAVTPFSFTALDPKDDEAPVTYNYNFTVDEQGPWGSTFEVAYVGNQSTNLSTSGNLQNQNVIPLNAFYGPDPAMGSTGYGQTNPASNLPQTADYRPYPNYTQVYVPNHINWSNYNALQASWNKQRGALTFGANYTWSKALAVRGDYNTGYIADPVNQHHDYGIVSFDRPQVFNLHYSWQEGVKFHGNRILSQVLNEWEISGINTLQSGPDLAILNGTTSFGLHGGAGYNVGTTTVSIPLSSAVWLGSSDYTLQPTVTCDPRHDLKKDQYVNGSCFGLPAQGSQGQWNLPDVHGPAYFKADLTVSKDFKLKDRQNMQFRVSGFNFLNHPLVSFNNSNMSTLSLNAGDAVTTYTTPQQALAGLAISNAAAFGSTAFKNGVRIVELGFKYNF
jgi:hypothetical protein